jgi:polyhydroxyalkanoate synthesis regulator phasin
MTDILKKAGLLGLGLVSLSEKKAREIAEELVEQGEATRKEAKDLSRDLLKKADKGRKDLEKEVEKITRAVLGKMNIATKKDLADLEKRLKAARPKARKKK